MAATSAEIHRLVDELETPLLFHFERSIQDWTNRHQGEPEDAIEEERTEKFDVRSLLLSQPQNAITELQFHKELFSKLKFNFLEHSTKLTFLKRILSIPPNWCSDADVKNHERTNEALKKQLKQFKMEIEDEKQQLMPLINQLCDGYNLLAEKQETAKAIAEDIAEMIRQHEKLVQFIDPNEPIQSELEAVLEELQPSVQELTSQLEESDRAIRASKTRLADFRAESAAIRKGSQTLSELIAEALKTVESLDTRVTQYCDWCEEWTNCLTAIQGISRIGVVKADTIQIVYEHSQSSPCMVDVRLPSSSMNAFDVKIQSGFAFAFDDIVETANEMIETDSLPHSLEFLLFAVRERYKACILKDQEVTKIKERAETLGISDIYFDDLDKATVVLGENAKAVTLLVGDNYPLVSSTIEVVSILPNGTLLDIDELQTRLLEHNARTVEEAIPLLF
ncbi:hypothetical protein DFJ73DRAFT_248053 [Zopfochytrium polystomum]|nr:hypothetical protein DFJ73DRAFT_248053 [Zopfochytrium polystomum]